MSISGHERLKMETADATATNVERIARLFPNVITEIEDENGNIQRGIDFDLLRQELSGDYVEGREERYDFTWVGKKQAIIEANRPIQKTLRPCIGESKDWEATENIYIEGDNLDALKLLQESYLNRVKMIYIDPPYNTGNDFIYNDKFVMDSDEYDEETGMVDEYGNRMFKNNKERGRYHSDWCSMLYPRLKLAHNLLQDDGVIFVSIDDNEVHNLRKIMDEIFGEENLIGTFIWKRRQNVDSRSKTGISNDHEYISCYGKTDRARLRGGLKDLNKYSNPDGDPRGLWMSADMTGLATQDQRPNLHYDLIDPNTGINYGCPLTGWRYAPQRMQQLIDNDEVIFPHKVDGRPRRKKFLKDLEDEYTGFSSMLQTVYNTQGTRELRSIFDGVEVIDFPKPIELIKVITEQGSTSKMNSIILDFFAGSSTTAHAVMQLNAEDGGNRKFIMVQLPETCDEKTEVRKAGFKNISEIGKERIRRAGEQIRKKIEEVNRQAKLGEEPKPIPDIGFRVFKIDETNMKDIYYSAAEYSQETIEGLVDNVKEDRTDLDLLYQVLINWGLPLDLRHDMEEIDGFTIHIVDTDALIACFEPNIPESVMRKIAGKKPLRAVFRDGSFRSSPGKLNIEGIFKTIAPDTKLRVI